MTLEVAIIIATVFPVIAAAVLCVAILFYGSCQSPIPANEWIETEYLE